MKIAYIGIDLLYPALPALEELGCEIVEVFTCNTDNKTEFNLQVCRFAKERQIPLFKDKIIINDINRLEKQGCTAVICGGYYHRIPVDYNNRLPIINIHPSLLPEGRGAWPMPVTILRGLKKSGVTLHKVTEKFDEGDIILQESVNVTQNDNLSTLTIKLQSLLPGMMQKLIGNFNYLLANATPQGTGEYWPSPVESDYIITPYTSARDADRILRAFYGYECIYQSGENRYGIIGGMICPCSGAHTLSQHFPVMGGYIQAERIRELL